MVFFGLFVCFSTVYIADKNQKKIPFDLGAQCLYILLVTNKNIAKDYNPKDYGALLDCHKRPHDNTVVLVKDLGGISKELPVGLHAK